MKAGPGTRAGARRCLILAGALLACTATSTAAENRATSSGDLAELADHPELWHLDNFGQDGGDHDADVDWPEALAVGGGDRRHDNRVGVIDTGVDARHRELDSRLCHLEPVNGVDDDGNGFVDDAYGWDFVERDRVPNDVHGHGTFVSGLIAAENSAGGSGAIGASRSACIVAIKAFNTLGGGRELAGLLAGIRYAVGLRLPVVNISAGINRYSPALVRAVRRARIRGTLVVAAAGNKGRNIDREPFYPASLTQANLITVGASTRADDVAAFSNRGRSSVDLSAPGRDLRSTDLRGGVRRGSGTSFATALVSAAASELLRLAGQLGPAGLKRRLITGAERRGGLRGSSRTARRLSIRGSIDELSRDRRTRPPRHLRARRRGGLVRFRWRPSERSQRSLLVLDGRVRLARRASRRHTAVLRVRPGRHHWRVIGIDRSGNEARSTLRRLR